MYNYSKLKILNHFQPLADLKRAISSSCPYSKKPKSKSQHDIISLPYLHMIIKNHISNSGMQVCLPSFLLRKALFPLKVHGFSLQSNFGGFQVHVILIPLHDVQMLVIKGGPTK